LPHPRRRTCEHGDCKRCGGDLPGSPHRDGFLGHLQRSTRGSDRSGEAALGILVMGVILLGGFAGCRLLLWEAAVRRRGRGGWTVGSERGLPHDRLEEALRGQEERCAVCTSPSTHLGE
jgi:hypothetical protein